MLKLLFSLSGFLVGILLSIISPEEMKPGKKYFVFIKNFLFYLIVFFSLSLFYVYQLGYFLLMPLAYLAFYTILIRKQKVYWREPLNYVFFGILYLFFYVFAFENSWLIILASMIFLYGLPTGTLFRLELVEKQERKYTYGVKHNK